MMVLRELISTAVKRDGDGSICERHWKTIITVVVANPDKLHNISQYGSNDQFSLIETSLLEL